MDPIRRAVIDVGTNSVKLLVADVAGSEVDPAWEGSRQTRLGSGFYETHRLQPAPIARTAEAVAAFAGIAREHRAVSIRVIATSAARDAVNPGELLAAVERESGLRVEIISGDQEAEWVFRGVTTDAELSAQPLLLLDVGGGSTEFILGQGEEKHYQASFPLGTVRLLAQIPHSDPPKPSELAANRRWLADFLSREVQPMLEPAMELEAATAYVGKGGLRFVGTGGTTTILARMEGQWEDFDRGRIEGTRLSLDRVRWHVERLWGLPLAQRREVAGLPADRADVILAGAVIYEAVMGQFGMPELRVSTRGLRFAAVLEEGPPGSAG